MFTIGSPDSGTANGRRGIPVRPNEYIITYGKAVSAPNMIGRQSLKKEFRRFRKIIRRNINSEVLKREVQRKLKLRSKREFRQIGSSVVTGRQGLTPEVFATRTGSRKNLMHDLVLSIEPNYIIKLLANTNDPRLPELWGLKDVSSGTVGMNAVSGWDLAGAGGEVVVGVVDTGIDLSHEDLISNLWRNPAEVPADGVDNDQNGHVDDVFGFNGLDGADAGMVMDDHYHGTHVAGTIAAHGNNARGVVGAAGPGGKIKLMPLKILDETGSGSLSAALAVYDYVLMMKQRGVNIKVLNNSWGFSNIFGPMMLESVFEKLDKAGVLNVAAAGNSAISNDSLIATYPASIDVPSVLSVAASNTDGSLAYFSNFGAKSVDLAAPGVDILSTVPSYSRGVLYEKLRGTSMASPHVSGAAAVLASLRPDLSPHQIKLVLTQNLTQVSALQGKLINPGVVNLKAAIEALYSTRFQNVKGKVTFSGTPLSNVQFDVPPFGVILSDQNGDYIIPDQQSGKTLTLTPKKFGFVFSPASVSVAVGIGDKIQNFTAAEAPYVPVQGRITFQGQPLAGVELNAGPFGRLSTDSNGRYAIPKVYTGSNLILVPVKAGYSFNPPSITAQISQPSTFDFSAQGTVHIKVRVTSRGMPLSGIRLNGNVAAVAWPYNYQRVTNSAGEVVFDEILAGSSYTINHLESGLTFSPNQLSGVVNNNLVLGMDLPGVSTGTYTLSGYALKRNEMPIAGAEIDAGALGKVISDATGKFSISNIPAGAAYTLRVQKQGFTFDPMEISGIMVSNRTLYFWGTEQLSYKISGVIKRVHAAANQGTEVTLHIDGQLKGSVLTNQSGEYEFLNLPVNASYSLSFRQKDMAFENHLYFGTLSSDLTQNLTAYYGSDYNHDGFVNSADYTIWRNNLGITGGALHSQGDGDGDGDVDGSDYMLYQRQYGSL